VSMARLAAIMWLIAVTTVAVLAYRVYGPALTGAPVSAQRTATGNGSPERAQQATPVITELAKAQPFAIRRRTTGTLQSPAIVTMRSRIDSQILEQHVTGGQFVKKGQLLFTLDNREIRAAIARDEATLAKDKATLAQAESTLKRQQFLADKKLSPEQEREAAQAAYEAAKQTVEADEAVLRASRLQLDYARIEAPIDGRLGAIEVTPGNLVRSSDASGLVTITQIRPLWVRFALPEGDVAALRAAERRNPPAPVAIYTGDQTPVATGQLDFVDSAVDTESGTITARATVANQNLALWPGQFVDVEVELGTRPDTVLLPSPVVLMGQQGPYVFIAQDDQTAAMRNVRLGGTLGNQTAILEGVQEGERVIVEGQVRITPGSRWVEADSPRVASEPRQQETIAR
jgi:multidrug efflux system membrane fusion protein